MSERIDVDFGEYRITGNPEKILATQGIESCVGLALFSSRERCLAHIRCGGLKDQSSQSEEQKRTEKMLKEIFSKKWEGGAVIYTPYRQQIERQPSHPLAEYIIDKLKNIGVYDPEIERETQYSGRTIHTKQVSLFPDKVRVFYYDNANHIMNPKNFPEFNF